jgi:diadenosine tetraphosphate (Ap4A) HIT family hydrolase
MNRDCLFCKIANGEIDSAKIWEDDEFLAILDAMPNTKGMTLVLTKKHYDSYAFDMAEDMYLKLMSASKKVAKILEKGLGVARVAMVMEGMGINHAHIKLYPLHGLRDKFEEILPQEKVFFERYRGYISTQTGPKAELSDLKKLAEEIKAKS